MQERAWKPVSAGKDTGEEGEWVSGLPGSPGKGRGRGPGTGEVEPTGAGEEKARGWEPSEEQVVEQV